MRYPSCLKVRFFSFAPEIADTTLAVCSRNSPGSAASVGCTARMYPFLAWKCGLQITPTRIRVERTSPSLGPRRCSRSRRRSKLPYVGGKCNSVLAICHNMHLRDAWEWAVALNIRSALGRWLSVWRFNYIIYGNDALTVVPVEELRSKSISEGLRVAPRAPTSSNIFCVPTSKTISLDKGRLSG
jgi:hypothetical protein